MGRKGRSLGTNTAIEMMKSVRHKPENDDLLKA
jgi:hypothetical protein